MADRTRRALSYAVSLTTHALLLWHLPIPVHAPDPPPERASVVRVERQQARPDASRPATGADGPDAVQRPVRAAGRRGDAPTRAPDPADDPEQARFVRTEAEDAVDHAVASHIESAHDTLGPTPARPAVAAAETGKRQPPRPDALGAPLQAVGGPMGDRSPGRSESEVAPAAHPRATSPEGVLEPAVTEASPAPAPGGAPDWWHPAVRFAMGTDADRKRAAEHAGGAPAPDSPRADARTSRPVQTGDRGPTPAEDPVPPSEVDADADVDRATRPERAVARHAEARRGARSANRLALVAASATSPQAVFDVASDVARPSVTARKTPRGVYVQEADAEIARRWYAGELDPGLLALGLTGSVTVRFVVSRSGRVGDVEITSSSGKVALDALAVGAVPERLPRLPRGVSAPLRHTLTFHLRRPSR